MLCHSKLVLDTIEKSSICRSRNDEVWQQVIKETKEKIKAVCLRRRVDCEVTRKNTGAAVHNDPSLMQQLSEAIVESTQVC